MWLARGFLGLFALIYVAIGISFWFWTLPMARTLDIELPTPTARADFAATYGGMMLGWAVFLAACTWRADWLPVGLWANALTLAGLAAARLHRVLIEPTPPRALIYQLLAIELAGLLVSIWLARRVG